MTHKTTHKGSVNWWKGSKISPQHFNTHLTQFLKGLVISSRVLRIKAKQILHNFLGWNYSFSHDFVGNVLTRGYMQLFFIADKKHQPTESATAQTKEALAKKCWQSAHINTVIIYCHISDGLCRLLYLYKCTQSCIISHAKLEHYKDRLFFFFFQK